MNKPIVYEKDNRVARIILNRPKRMNAISSELPAELRTAVKRANEDDEVHVIVLSGAGENFCSGYDLKEFAEEPRPTEGSQEMPWDPMIDYKLMKENTENFMSLWRSSVPTIGKIRGFAIGGGSDIALCCDILVVEEDARIGYPPARVWGCPTTEMWVYKIGAEKAKRMLLTGDIIDGKEAEEMGLAQKSAPSHKLDDEVNKFTERMTSIPRNQLMMQKMMINQTYYNMGLETTQMIATLFDGIARHTPEGVAFKKRCEEVGFKKAVKERDQGKISENKES